MSKKYGKTSVENNIEKTCLEKVKKADIVLVIYNGKAGYLCLEEFREARESGGHRTYTLDIVVENEKTKQGEVKSEKDSILRRKLRVFGVISLDGKEVRKQK